ncbi:HpcH/HpaI aldolase/citrate lyase family protein [Caballeronia telluris]|uniref:Citrate lyase subunit beta n=1 Tax=Caballeronia telluris TaxID=326475 RepID=A0A158K4P5_9BURK|nr:CoA ester lyase [Caballeronia telluris]SAL76108.1 citrate lyase subunit beta [Caballeronia telluris]
MNALSTRRIRRSMLLTPAHRRDRVVGAMNLPVDSFAFDLEDGVPPGRRDEAREILSQVLPTLETGERERVVRINAPGTDDCLHDLDALPLEHLDAVLVPKVESAEQMRALDVLLTAREGGRGAPIRLIVTLETPRGVLNALAIGDASPRCCAFFFGSGDYTMETGAAITPTALLWARSTIVAAAGALRIDAIDAPYLAGLRDPQGTFEDAARSRELGFSGKVVFHPAQIEPVHRAFTPDAGEVARARRIIDAFEQVKASGEGTAIVDGEFVAIDLVPRMHRVIEIAGYDARRSA